MKKGIPPEVITELDFRQKKKINPITVNVIVEEHQAKIPIPKKLRLNMELSKGAKCIMRYDKAKKELVCKF